ncbi:GDSL esterase/lipase APG-like [Cicer arietinum]|uniref:GDSL esterase/lipase APG-like n=1 Tax=Cicer arietinum TaxID=3827 RepID=UPI003CC62544
MNMNNREAFFVILALVLLSWGNAQDTLVPAIITFGDSAVDIGNNDYLPTLLKLTILVMEGTSSTINPLEAETLGFKSYAPTYLSSQATGKNLLIGAKFASAASSYDKKASILNVSL